MITANSTMLPKKLECVARAEGLMRDNHVTSAAASAPAPNR